MDLVVLRKTTLDFINVFPVSIVFTPRTKTQKPAGGFTWQAGTPRNPQTVTFIEEGATAGHPAPTVTLDGVERKVEMEIVAPWDSTMSRYDTFVHQGKEWEVVDIFYDNGYERRALVAGRG